MKKLCLLFIIITIFCQIYAHEYVNKWFFPFGQYDEYQEDGFLELTLNYGYLDNPNFTGNNVMKEGNIDIEVPQNIGPLLINYGLGKYITLSVQSFIYKKVLVTELRNDRLNELGEYAIDGNFNLLFTFKKYIYFMLNISPYFSAKSRYDRGNVVLSSMLPSAGVRLFESDFFIITLEFGFIITPENAYTLIYTGIGFSPWEEWSINVEFESVHRAISGFRSYKGSTVFLYPFRHFETAAGVYFIYKDFSGDIVKGLRYIASIQYNFEYKPRKK